MIGQVDQNDNALGWLANNMQNEAVRVQYLNAFYFIVTTMTTVGYGDFSGHTTFEQIYCICLMMTGVFIFSMVSGSLASILASFDQVNADLQAKVMFLKRLQTKYELPPEICKEINKCLIYDHQMAVTGLLKFIENLPA